MTPRNPRRADFPLLAANPELYYLDSAATSQKPAAVLDAMRAYYERDNANPHRGAYTLSARATDRYHAARERIAAFLGASDADCLIFTRGTTESLNLVVTAWGHANVGEGDEIVVTALEHHANFVPWQQLAMARGATFRICPLTDDHRVDLDALRAMVGPRTRVVAFSHVSNALGTINPIHEITAIAREVGALVVCDGAQGAPHLRIDFDTLDVDFYAFSGHKMCGPMGIGGLLGRRAILEAMSPYQFGGDMIEFVRDEDSTWNVLPHKFEAGTPNVGDAIGLAAACDYLDGIGMDEVARHERALLRLASERLQELDGVRVYGPPPSERSGVVSFSMDDVHPHDLATVLDQDGVCIRAGQHCAQPLMRRLGVAATARASFYVYSDEADVDALVVGLRRAKALFGA
ncbi:MAG: cysteine desulfurase, aminotransferase class-v [Gemmatimonadetes bacterium]|nr:cysteine desulfurase, aminotransferase class-v [Gemmatimonadota bacterium]